MLKKFFVFITLATTPLLAHPTLVIGVAGGTGSGKTTLAERLIEAFPGRAILISQDSYYRPLTNLPEEERLKTNFDHPDALDFSMLYEHLLALKNHEAIDQPIYNFHIHDREKEARRIEPADLIIVEGILIFAIPEVRDLIDFKIFVDTDDDVRVLRRIERDLKERSRDFLSVKNQYLNTVKPMHDAFVEPSKQYADIIVPRGGKNPLALQMILCKLRSDLVKDELFCTANP